MSHDSDDRQQVFLGNLSYAATEEDIIRAFQEHGVRVLQVRIPFDEDRRMPRGYAFVDIETDRRIADVVHDMNGYVFHNRPCRADFVHARIARRRSSNRDVWED
jgi:RNA recognition motif-containing protein